MRKLINDHGLSHKISIDSAGTANYHTGKSPDKRMSATLEKRGVPTGGQARQFVKKDFAEFDLILAMDEENQRNILRLAKSAEDREKVKLFLAFSKKYSQQSVPDPYYGGQDGFDLVAEMMEDGCQGILDSLNTKRS